jgi:hypothetical protein
LNRCITFLPRPGNERVALDKVPGNQASLSGISIMIGHLSPAVAD